MEFIRRMEFLGRMAEAGPQARPATGSLSSGIELVIIEFINIFDHFEHKRWHEHLVGWVHFGGDNLDIEFHHVFNLGRDHLGRIDFGWFDLGWFDLGWFDLGWFDLGRQHHDLDLRRHRRA